MQTINSVNRIDTTPAPILRVSETQPASESQQWECCCPELCQLDHDN